MTCSSFLGSLVHCLKLNIVLYTHFDVVYSCSDRVERRGRHTACVGVLSFAGQPAGSVPRETAAPAGVPPVFIPLDPRAVSIPPELTAGITRNPTLSVN